MTREGGDGSGTTTNPGEAGQDVAAAETVPLGPPRPGDRRPAPPATLDLPVMPRDRYQIDGEVARGGMGRILVGYDRWLHRPIALKEALLADPALAIRFAREALLTARLQHPAIVPVYEAGRWDTGEPFYSMRFIAGESLDRVIAGAQTLDERLALIPAVITAVDAIAYAHGQGVVHRDLKPANVLVGPFGETVVIDWGLAKRVDAGDDESPAVAVPVLDHRLTAAGAVLGTLAYMPPEQAAGDPVDERSDVYGLGAILYHVLAGAPPLAPQSTDAMVDRLFAGPPVPLAERQPGVPADLLAIVDKALARSPVQRYRSASELADDLKRFQRGQLVAAHAYSRAQLLRRWLRRHRTVAVVVAAALVTLAVGAGISVSRILREQERTEAQRALSEVHRADAEELMGFMLFDLQDRLQDIGRLDLLAAVAGRAADYYTRTPGGSEDADYRRVYSLRRLSDVLASQGDVAGALERLRTALSLTEQWAAADPTSGRWQHELGATHFQLGNVLAAQGDTAGAVREYEAAVAVAEGLIAREPTDERRGELSTTRQRLGNVLRLRGDSARALTEYRTAAAIDAALAAAKPDDAGRQRNLSVSHGKVGDLLHDLGDLAGALREYEAALAIDQRRVARDPGNLKAQADLLVSHGQIGDLYWARGERAKALEGFRTATAIADRVAGQEPSNVDWQANAAVGHERVGDALLAEGRVADALAEYRTAQSISARAAGLDPSNTDLQRPLAVAHSKVGDALLERGDVAPALTEYRAALAIRRRLAEHDPDNADAQRRLSIAHDRLADALLVKGDVAGGIREYRAALDIARRLVAKDPSNARWQERLGGTQRSLGAALLRSGDAQGAMAELRAAIAIFAALSNGEPSNAHWEEQLAGSYEKLGDAHLARNDRSGALAAYEAAAAGLDRLAARTTTPEWNEAASRMRARIKSCCR